MDFDRWVVACFAFVGVVGLGSRAAGDRPLPLSVPLSSEAPETRRFHESPQVTQLTVARAPPPPAIGPPVAPFPGDARPTSGVPAADSAMTLAELEEIALANNPTLVQADAWVRAARAKCLQVGLYPNPSIIYRGEEIGTDGRAGQQGAFFAQEIVTAGKLGLRRAVASHEVRQAEHARQAQYGRVLNDLRTAWYDVLAAQRAVKLNEELVRIGQQGTKAAEELLAAKEVSRVDLLQARIEQLRAGLQLDGARHRYLAAWRRMTAVLGLPEMKPTLLWGDLEGDLPQLTWQESLERLLAESPELARARSGVQRARWAVAREYAQRIPNFALETGVQYQHGNDDTVVGVQLGLPLPIFDRNQGNILKAQAELAAAENEVRRVKLALQDRLATVFQRYASARHQAGRYRSEIIPNAKESLDLVGSGYRQGELDYLTLLTAQRTYTQVSLAHLESLREVRAGSVLIEGLLLTGGLSGDNR